MANLYSIVDLFERFEEMPIEVTPQHCITVRNRNIQCGRCADACTSKAIHVKNNVMTVDPEKCIGCASCAAVCPTGVFIPTKPSNDELLQACEDSLNANQGRVVIACSALAEAVMNSLKPHSCVEVPCLGRIEESLLVLLAQAGAEEIVLVLTKCETCSYTRGSEIVEIAAEAANTLFSVWDVPCKVRLAQKLPSWVKKTANDDYDRQRRSFFTGIKGEARNVAATMTSYTLESALGVSEKKAAPLLVRVDHRGILPQFSPYYHERLVQGLAELGTPHDECIDTRRWGRVEIDEQACRACRICATFCPTNALAKFDNESEGAKVSFGLTHRSHICVQCETCAGVCPVQALHVFSDVSSKKIASDEVTCFKMKEPKSRAAVSSVNRGFAFQK